jgi:hypothetical protein
MEYIDEMIERLKQQDMDLEVEGEVSGFFGVHIKRNIVDGTILLTQSELTKRSIEALEVGGLPIKQTPAAAEPLVKDEDGEEPDESFNYASEIGMMKKSYRTIRDLI